MLRLWICALAAVLAGWAAAEELRIVVEGSAAAGWTDNALDAPLSVPDVFQSRTGRIVIAGGGDDVSLRGGLELVQTRFAAYDFMDSDELSGEIEATVHLSDAVSLRLGYAGSHTALGEALVVGGGILALRRSVSGQEVGAELVAQHDALRLSLGFAHEWVRHGEADLSALGLVPARLSPDADATGLRLGLVRSLAPGLALGGEALVRLVAVSPGDRIAFGRQPADGLRLSAGYDVEARAGLSATVRAGLDLARPRAGPEPAAAGPHAAFSLEAALRGGFVLGFEAETGLELADPVDGIASQARRFGASLRYVTLPSVELFARMAFSREAGLYDRFLFLEERSVSVGFVRRVDGRFSHGVTLSRALRSEPGTGHVRTSLLLMVSGRL